MILKSDDFFFFPAFDVPREAAALLIQKTALVVPSPILRVQDQ